MAEDEYDSMWEDDCDEWSDKPKKSTRMPTIQELNAQIVKLERENFQLKLRVHLNETKGTVEPITAAAPRKSQRELQMEQETQVLKVEKEQLELKVQQLQSQLRREIELKEQTEVKEASLRNKVTELKNYAQLLERERELNRLRTTVCAGSPSRQSLTNVLSPLVSKTTIAVNTEPAIEVENALTPLKAEPQGRERARIEELETALASLQFQLQGVSEERLLLAQRLTASEEARKRDAMFMGKRAKEALESLQMENQALKLENDELREKVKTLEAKCAALKKAANAQLTNQLIYHQTALEKVHQEQALLIEELQKLKKSCPLHKQPVVELCKKDPLIDLEGTYEGTQSPYEAKDSSHFITSPRSLNQSGKTSACVLDWEAPADHDSTQALEPDKPDDGSSEEKISQLNKKLHEKNSKLAIKLQKTRESLKRAIAMLEHSEKDKEGMEKIICRQLHRTHLILSDVKETLTKAKEGDSCELCSEFLKDSQ